MLHLETTQVGVYTVFTWQNFRHHIIDFPFPHFEFAVKHWLRVFVSEVESCLRSFCYSEIHLPVFTLFDWTLCELDVDRVHLIAQ